MTKPKKREPDAGKVKYQLTERERATLSTHIGPLDREALAPRVKVLNGEVATISLDHPNATVGRGLLMEALGTASSDFTNVILRQLVQVGSQSREYALVTRV